MKPAIDMSQTATNRRPDATHRADPTPIGGRGHASLRAVDRAVGDLRRGDPVLVRPDSGPALLIAAAESVSDHSLDRLERLTGRVPGVVLTAPRARSLGFRVPDEGSVAWLDLDLPISVDKVRALADPVAPSPAGLADTPPTRWIDGTSRDGAVAAARLLKLARLLPAALAVPVDRPFGTERLINSTDILSVAAYDIDHYQEHAARSLARVAAASVPLEDAEVTEIVAFRPSDGGQEHLAIVIGTPDPDQPALVRLHSECFTGDLLGSLRCDCGPQLRGAIREIAKAGAGVLLYLAQEGRGIGLVNKLRAYRLQDESADTLEANEMLGYAADERLYRPAAQMLAALGLTRIRLLTNNPDKVAGLERLGLEVSERVPHVFPSNGHNEAYLRTKKERAGHYL